MAVSTFAITALIGVGPALGSPQAAGSATEAALPPIEAMRLLDTTVFASTPPSAFRGGSRCDTDGDAFVQLASLVGSPEHVEPSSSVSEVIPDEKRIEVYRATQLSPSDYPNARLLDFNVLPDGALYALIFTRANEPGNRPPPEPQYYVERFKDDGTKDSITAIQAPPGVAHWFADMLGAFPDGDLLIVGTSTAGAERPSGSSWQPFTAIYDTAGRFVSEVKLPGDVVNNLNESGTAKAGSAAGASAQSSPAATSKPRQYFEVAISTGGLVNGPDGNVWILRASDPMRLYAVNSAGQVAEHFRVSPPFPGLVPASFGFAAGQIFLNFVRFANVPSAGSGPSHLVGIFDLSLKRFEALYSLPDTEKRFRVLACSDANRGFLYLGATPDDHLAVFDYGP